jgi:hypothetical protein
MDVGRQGEMRSRGRAAAGSATTIPIIARNERPPSTPFASLPPCSGDDRFGSASDLGPTGLNVRYRSSDAKSRHSASGPLQSSTRRTAVVLFLRSSGCRRFNTGPRPVRCSYEAGFAKAIHDQLEIVGILVGQHFAAMFQRILGVDAKHFLPLATGFLEPTQMAVARRQEHA